MLVSDKVIDYETGEIIEGDAATLINFEHEACINAMENTVIHAWKCGNILIAQKEITPFGEWMSWCMLNLDFSIRTARRYMQLVTRWDTRVPLEDITSIRAGLRLIAAEAKRDKEPEPETETVFSWYRDERVIAMQDGWKAIDLCVPLLMKPDRDPGVARHFLEIAKKKLQQILEEIGDLEGE